MRFVVVADNSTRAAAAAEELRAAGYRLEGVVNPADLGRGRASSSVAVVAARGLSAALEACRSIRARAIAVTILLLASADGDMARAAGADFFWESSWDVAAVAEQARKLVRPGALHVSDGRLLLDDRLVKLTGKPLLLAGYLVRRAHEHAARESDRLVVSHPVPLVPREELKRAIWGSADTSDHRLDQTIYVIRKALEPEDWRLEVVPGQGYWMSVM